MTVPGSGLARAGNRTPELPCTHAGVARASAGLKPPVLRPVVWVGNAKKHLTCFPEGARKLGDDLQLIQWGGVRQRLRRSRPQGCRPASGRGADRLSRVQDPAGPGAEAARDRRSARHRAARRVAPDERAFQPLHHRQAARFSETAGPEGNDRSQPSPRRRTLSAGDDCPVARSNIAKA